MSNFRRPEFITEREWSTFDEDTQRRWVEYAQNVMWLSKQPQFRNWLYVTLNDPRFCNTDGSPMRSTTEETFRAIGIQDAGRAMRLVVQTVAPKMWMRLMHEAFNEAQGAPPEKGAEE